MMTTGDYQKQIQIDADPDKVFSTLTNVAEFGIRDERDEFFVLSQ